MTQSALRIGFAIVLALSILLAPRIAAAQVIHGCIQNSNGSLRIIAATDTCKNSETRTSWNAIGPKGDKGEPGAGLDTGTIAGQVLSCNGPAAHALAYLAGDSFVAVTGFDGNFRLSHVPPGTYRVTVETAGGMSGTRPAVVVTAASTTAVGALNPSLLSDPANCGSCGRACAPGQICAAAQCTSANACDGVICPGFLPCVGGICPEASCIGVLCPFGQACNQGACVVQGFCFGVTCPPGTACQGGACTVPSLACAGVLCPVGSTCVNGVCQ